MTERKGWTATILGFAGHDVCAHICCSLRKAMGDKERHGHGYALA